MASSILLKSLISKSNNVQKCSGLTYTVVRNQWNYQYIPNKNHPKTEKEREASAKKYGLTPAEYEPLPETENCGDYPNLKGWISPESRDVFYPYDFPEYKRNFNEPLHQSENLYGEDRFNYSKRPRFSTTVMASCFFGTVGSFLIVFFICEDYKMGRPVIAKQYPCDGPHYTFEPK